MVHEGGVRLDVNDGKFVFTLNDGRVLTPAASAPTKPVTVDAILAWNRLQGKAIDERTAVSNVTDRRMDDDLAVQGLLQADGALEWRPPKPAM